MLRFALLLAALVVFAPGFFDQALNGADDSFWLLNLVCILVTLLPLSRFRRPLKDTLWAVVILFVFLMGYFVKTFIFSRDVANGYTFILSRDPTLLFINANILAAGYRWITVSYVLFCLLSWYLLGLESGDRRERVLILLRDQPSHSRIGTTAIAAFALLVVCLIIEVHFGISVAGLQVQSGLPFHLDTVVIRYTIDLGPTLLLLCIWSADRSRERFVFWMSMTMLAVFATAYGFTSTSRGSLISFFIPVLFLWLLTDGLTTARKVLLGVILGGTVLLYPILSSIRQIRMVTGAGFSAAISLALPASGGTDPISASLATLPFILTRVSGADGIWHSLAYVPDTFSLVHIVDLLFRNSFDVYYTRMVVGGLNPADFSAPGLVAAFMLLGGLPAVLAFMALYLVGVWSLWSRLWRLRTAPVAAAFSTGVILNFTSEGGLLFQNIVALLLVIFITEWWYRRVLLDKGGVQDAGPIQTGLSQSQHLPVVTARPAETPPAGFP